ncbi:MAG: SPASM domain-containing protein [Candidatus Gastranaerophilaceae bacterium]
MKNEEILKKAKEILGRDFTCIVPFEHLFFSCDGSIFPCCPALVNNYTFGNIFRSNSANEIWNGEEAQKFRKSVLDGSFRFCNLDSCINLNSLKNDSRFRADLKNKSKIADLPKEVFFHIDMACNVRCITCRDEKMFLEKEVKKYTEITDSILIPILKNAERVYLNGAGEVFASSLCKNLIQKITKIYPKIRFNIITNGILATEKNINEFGLRNKICSVEISMHAATKETYDKIVRGGDFDKVMENLKFLAGIKQNENINAIWLNFVVSSYNYKEMIDFQKLADSLGVNTRFWEYRKWGNAKLDERYDEVAIFEPSHPEYEKYLKIVKNKIFEQPNCEINYKLRPFN